MSGMKATALHSVSAMCRRSTRLDEGAFLPFRGLLASAAVEAR
jgi:hypothetical protein